MFTRGLYGFVDCITQRSCNVCVVTYIRTKISCNPEEFLNPLLRIQASSRLCYENRKLIFAKKLEF